MKTVKISDYCYHKLQRILFKDSPLENAAFLLIGISIVKDNEVFLVRRVIEIPEEMFDVKSEYHLEISSQAINGIISLCEVNQLGLALCHSHPTSDHELTYSPSDDFGEQNIFKPFKKILPNLPLISILWGREKIISRCWKNENNTFLIDNLEIIGDVIKKLDLNNSLKLPNIVSTEYNRQISAFGEEGQKKILSTKVGIVGTGGTGSIIAEQLTRLGVGDFKIADYDTFGRSNISRMYGSYAKDIPKKSSLKVLKISKYKVDLIKKHLKAINPGIKIQTFKKSIVQKEVAECFLDRDVIFSCTDDHWGRAVINQICYQYLIPVINTGVRLSSKNNMFISGNIVSHSLGPDKPCLWCYEYLKPKIIEAESMTPQERIKLVHDGYIENIDIPQPSVITFTSLGSCMSMEIFLNLITGYLGEYGKLSSLRSDMLNLDIRRGTTQIKDNCICKKVFARGDCYTLFTV